MHSQTERLQLWQYHFLPADCGSWIANPGNQNAVTNSQFLSPTLTRSVPGWGRYRNALPIKNNCFWMWLSSGHQPFQELFSPRFFIFQLNGSSVILLLAGGSIRHRSRAGNVPGCIVLNGFVRRAHPKGFLIRSGQDLTKIKVIGLGQLFYLDLIAPAERHRRVRHGSRAVMSHRCRTSGYRGRDRECPSYTTGPFGLDDLRGLGLSPRLTGKQ